ncbi:MAG: restriction endonuclease [Magnetococcales bacterium]|nr:restriction endonuclease [Magnetococcales bacterium]
MNTEGGNLSHDELIDKMAAMMRNQKLYSHRIGVRNNYLEAFRALMEMGRDFERENSDQTPPGEADENDFNCQEIIFPPVLLNEDGLWDELIIKLNRDHIKLHDLAPDRFEELIGELLHRAGWDIELTGRTNDGGIDLIGLKRIDPGLPFRMMVQCKRHAPHRRVGVTVVREVWAVKQSRHFHQAMIATSSEFTKPAILQADAWALSLQDRRNLLDWCQKHAERRDRFPLSSNISGSGLKKHDTK